MSIKDDLLKKDELKIVLSEHEFDLARALNLTLQWDTRGRRITASYLGVLVLHHHPKFTIPDGKAAEYQIDLDDRDSRTLVVTLVDAQEA